MPACYGRESESSGTCAMDILSLLRSGGSQTCWSQEHFTILKIIEEPKVLLSL